MLRPLLITISIAFVLAPASALGWNQTKTCIDASEIDPLAPSSSPICEGNEIGRGFHWPSAWVRYRINQDGSPDDFPHEDGIDPELLATLRDAFEVWNEPECSRFEFVGGDLTDIADFNPTDRVNIVVFKSDWPYASQSIGLTSVTVKADGEIVDADMELNDESYVFTNVDPPARVQIDVRNTVTHEAGHVLGLDHSPVAESTMQFEASDGEINKRDLHEDDIEGICAIYPIDGPDAEDDDDEGCCTQVQRQSSTPLWPALLAGVLGFVGLLRRR